MKSLLLLLSAGLFLTACQTPSDSTRSQANVCEVHGATMFKRTVPYAHGMIPMSREEAKRGEWGRRMKHYPHPGDCEPATGIVLPGQHGKTLVYVCPKCETAKKEMAAKPAQ